MENNNTNLSPETYNPHMAESYQKPSSLQPDLYLEPTNRSNARYMTILPSGTFLVSSGLAQEWNLKNKMHVLLAYDKAQHAICLKFIDKRDTRAAKITHPKNTKALRIQRKKFFKHYEIPLKEVSGKYHVQKEYIDGQNGGQWSVIYLNDKRSKIGYSPGIKRARSRRIKTAI